VGEGDGVPLVTPLVQSTTYCRGAVGSNPEHQYSRVSNPTVAALEDELGRLEGAPRAVCFSSGLAAETALFLTLVRAGEHVVCGRSVYGGTTRLLQRVLSGLGVETTFVDATDAREVARAVRGNTRVVFVETPSNPTLELTDIRAVARVTRERGITLVVDNTFLTPVLQQPLELGADVSLYATTKFIEGHSVATGGAVVSRDAALLERLRFIRKSTGGIQTPFNAWLTLQGLKTLALRVAAASANASAIARWLSEREEVRAVFYPGLLGGAGRELAEAQHLGAHGAVVTFELEGDVAFARAFVERLRFCRLVEHVGSVETLITHPATMTHADVPPEERRAAGLTDGLLRLSVGIEDPARVIGDIEQGLEAAQGSCTTVWGEVARVL